MEISQSTRYDSSSLVSIQALRAIAALLVFWGHAINAVHLKVAADFPHLYGPFGVDLFFVISGFVMVYSSERLFGQPGAPMTFFARRLARRRKRSGHGHQPQGCRPLRFRSAEHGPARGVRLHSAAFGGLQPIRLLDSHRSRQLLDLPAAVPHHAGTALGTRLPARRHQ